MPDATLTCIDLWIKAGSLYEHSGEEGIAHFLEHMVFKGGNNLKEGDFDRQIEALGGSSNAATGFDDVHFYVLIPHESVEIALNLLLNLVLTPSFESKAFEMEKEVVLEEIAQHEDQPDEQIFQELLKICWEGHPYGRPILGLKRSLKQITRVDMQYFHKRLYTGNNFSISIAGQIPNDFENILKSSILNKLKSQSQITSLTTKHREVPFKRERRKIELKRIESSRLIMAWPVPPANEQLIVMGMDIATSLLAEGRRSRLVERLREDLQIVESIDMDVTSLEKGGLIVLEISCSEDQLKNVEEEINKILKTIFINGPSSQEVSRAHQIVRNSYCFSIESSGNVASIIGSQALWNRHQSLLNPLKDIEYWTCENLQKKIYSRLQPEYSSTLIATPSK